MGDPNRDVMLALLGARPDEYGEDGPSYGIQQRAQFAVDETKPKPLFSSRRALSLWRISVFGDLLVTFSYGTESSFREFTVRAPCVGFFPGGVQVKAVPRVAAPREEVIEAMLTATPAFAHGKEQQLLNTAAAGDSFPDNAVRFTATVLSTVNLQGTAVNIGAGDSIALFAGSSLTAGAGIVEFGT